MTVASAGEKRACPALLEPGKRGKWEVGGVFGYVKPCQPQLRVCELEAYKAVYCGLCRQLGRSFGLLARFTLSYDTTFLAILAMGVSEGEPDLSPGRCPFNPAKRMPVCRENPALALSADAAALILYWKLRDDLSDEGLAKGLLARLGLLLARGPYRKAARRRPELAEVFRRMVEEQARLEADRCANLDQAAEPTAAALSAVFATLSQGEGQRRVLARLGYLVGRYVYLADALDDLEKDREAGRYNPLIQAHGQGGAGLPELRRQGLGSLYLTIGEAEKTYRLLEVRRFAPILENILTLGLMGTADSLARAGEGETERS